MDVTIGRCGVADIDDVVRFIDEHWKAGHILATFRPLLDWQHRDADGSGYSFVVARRRADAQIVGILGYVATKRFDPLLVRDCVVWLTTWKVRDDAGVAGLGIQLLQHLTRLEPHAAIGAIGLTPSTLPIYQAFGYEVGELRHYVQPNPHSARFELARLLSSGDDRPAPVPAAAGRSLDARPLASDAAIDAAEWSSPDAVFPRKSAEYFRRRYVAHPIYAYTVLTFVEGRAPVGLMAVRIAEHAGSRALRIVDFAGPPDVLARVGPTVQSLLVEHRAEYADVYNAGIPAGVLAAAGFSAVDPEGPEVVPDHFEPYERRNVRLWFAIKRNASAARLVLFKGDGDQDRPNQGPGSSR